MFPFIYEWIWDPSHYIFFGGLYYALAIISAGMTYAVGKAFYEAFLTQNEEEHHDH